jgi:hypothetical protein
VKVAAGAWRQWTVLRVETISARLVLARLEAEARSVSEFGTEAEEEGKLAIAIRDRGIVGIRETKRA